MSRLYGDWPKGTVETLLTQATDGITELGGAEVAAALFGIAELERKQVGIITLYF